MNEITQAIHAFEADYADYMGMYGIGKEQEQYIIDEDMERFEGAAGLVQHHMDSVRLRQQGGVKLDAEAWHNNSELATWRQQVVQIIEKIDRQRQLNEVLLQKVLERTRGEMKKIQQSRQAVRGYGKSKRQGGRFFDGVR